MTLIIIFSIPFPISIICTTVIIRLYHGNNGTNSSLNSSHPLRSRVSWRCKVVKSQLSELYKTVIPIDQWTKGRIIRTLQSFVTMIEITASFAAEGSRSKPLIVAFERHCDRHARAQLTLCIIEHKLLRVRHAVSGHSTRKQSSRRHAWKSVETNT